MLSSLDAKKAEEFGASLALYLIEKMPPGKHLNESKVASKTEYLLAKLEVRVRSFKQTEKLNIYKTAKLGNAFKWQLKDAGYDQAYIDKLVEWLVKTL